MMLYTSLSLFLAYHIVIFTSSILVTLRVAYNVLTFHVLINSTFVAGLCSLSQRAPRLQQLYWRQDVIFIDIGDSYVYCLRL